MQLSTAVRPTAGAAGANSVDILLIGHVTRDLVSADPNGPYRLGGTVSFAAITALRLGRQPTIVTRAAADTNLAELPAAVDLRVLPSATTSTGNRFQMNNATIAMMTANVTWMSVMGGRACERDYN